MIESETINDDVQMVLQFPRKKISNTTLKYLRDKKLITSWQYDVYRFTVSSPDERFLPSDIAVVKHVNELLIRHYEGVCMSGKVGRPRKLLVNNESEAARENRLGPGRPCGSVDKQKKSLLSLRDRRERCGGEEAVVAPVGKIEADYKLIMAQPKRKISPLTLKWLKDIGRVSGEQYALYNWASECPEQRTLITDRSVIETVNNKLIWMYENDMKRTS